MVEAYSSTCNHYDTIINNESFLTCIDCGLEIEQIFCHPDTHDNDSIISTPITDFDARKLEEKPNFHKKFKNCEWENERKSNRFY